MREVGVLEAKTNFSALINEVEESGEEIVVTRHGKPVARILRARPEDADRRAARRDAMAAIIALREDVAKRYPNPEPFDLREALDRDRGDEWS